VIKKTFILILVLSISLWAYHLNASEPEERNGNSSKKRYLHEAYLTNSSSHYMFGIAGTRMCKYFEPLDKEVVWVGRFNLLANVNAVFIAEWYAPDGKIFEKRCFKHLEGGNTRYSITALKIKDNVPETLYGKWKVVIFWDNEKIDERYFYIDVESNLAKARIEEKQRW